MHLQKLGFGGKEGKMKCKICYQNETNNTSGICWKCCGGYSIPLDVIYKYGVSRVSLFYPYDNLIDWALNRHT